MYFGTKSYLKSNRNHTAKHTCNKNKRALKEPVDSVYGRARACGRQAVETGLIMEGD